MSLATTHLAPHEQRCPRCSGVITRDGAPVHEHHPSCSYWSLRCRICQLPIVGLHSRAPHPTREELCFMCGDLLEVDSHP